MKSVISIVHPDDEAYEPGPFASRELTERALEEDGWIWQPDVDIRERTSRSKRRVRLKAVVVPLRDAAELAAL